MNILESEIEELIYDAWQEDAGASLSSTGLELYGYNGELLRQYRLGDVGIIDLLHIRVQPYARLDDDNDRCLEITVIELKRGELDYSALGQLARYMSNIENSIRDRLSKRTHLDLRGILIGKSCAGGDFVYAVDAARNISMYTFSLDMKSGLRFEERSDWYSKLSRPSDVDGILSACAAMWGEHVQSELERISAESGTE